MKIVMGILGILGILFSTALVASTAARAQTIAPSPYLAASDIDAPYPPPPPVYGPYGAPAPRYRPPVAYQGGPAYGLPPLLPTTEVYGVLRDNGFSPLGIPRLRGMVYVIGVLDRNGDDGRLVIDARDGRILRFMPAWRVGDRFRGGGYYGPVPGPGPRPEPYDDDYRSEARPSVPGPRYASRTPMVPPPHVIPANPVGGPPKTASARPATRPAKHTASIAPKDVPARSTPEHKETAKERAKASVKEPAKPPVKEAARESSKDIASGISKDTGKAPVKDAGPAARPEPPKQQSASVQSTTTGSVRAEAKPVQHAPAPATEAKSPEPKILPTQPMPQVQSFN